MNTEAVIHIYSGILLSHKKEHIWVCANEVDEPRASCVEFKSEREKQISYINMFIRNLERWYWWTYLQGSIRDTDTENRLIDLGRRRGRREKHGNICTTICKTDSQWEFIVWIRKLKQGLCNNLEGGDGLGGGREVQEGGHIGIPMADPCWHVAEINTIL